MTARTIRPLLAIPAVLCCLALAGCGTTDAPDPAQAIASSLPGLAAPSGDPTVPAMATASPPPGHVVQVHGPFDDRLTLDRLGFDGHQVSGRVTITSDVSELLELQVLAGFHDADGRLLGTARFTHHLGGAHDHGGGEEESPAAPVSNAQPTEEFTIAVPEGLRGRARSATVAVPVLVNE
ncbi:hypothetical protein GCM10027030_13490 [Luteococcus sediminum]